MPDPTRQSCPTWTASVVLFVCFFLVSLGLGYPAVARYDPGKAGNYDAAVYCKMVLGEPVGSPCAQRPLLPTLARGVYHVLGRLDLGKWDRAGASLLLVNATLVALSALLLMRMAAAVTHDAAATILAPFVYLSSFAVVNFHLAGLIDAGEGLFLIALMLSLLQGRWWLAPILVAVGAMAKETVVPFGLCAMVAWWVAARLRGSAVSRSALVATTGAAVLGLASLAACRWLVDVPAYEAHQLSWARLAAIPSNMLDCLFAKTQVYVFAMLVPLGLPRLGRLPVPLLAASLAMACCAVLLGAYAAIGDNLHRPIFNTLGPVLLISCSMLLCELAGRKDE